MRIAASWEAKKHQVPKCEELAATCICAWRYPCAPSMHAKPVATGLSRLWFTCLWWTPGYPTTLACLREATTTQEAQPPPLFFFPPSPLPTCPLLFLFGCPAIILSSPGGTTHTRHKLDYTPQDGPTKWCTAGSPPWAAGRVARGGSRCASTCWTGYHKLLMSCCHPVR